MRRRCWCFTMLAAAISCAPARAAGQVPATQPDVYAAPVGAPYRAEEVSVQSPYGHSLRGTLTIPIGDRGPLPVVVLISGSGSQTRDGSLPGDAYRPFHQMADTLSRRGIAVLRMDDRGIAEGRPMLPSALQVAEDVRAALAFLRGRADMDRGRMALAGHSEGGMVALMVGAADPSLRALVLMAAPALPPAEGVREQVRRAVARSAADRTPAERDSILRVAMANVERQLQGDWGRQSGTYDPLAAARAVRSAGVLVLHGATDRQVPAAQADQLVAALAGAGGVDHTVFPGLNHLFLPDPDGDPEGYQALPSQRIPDAVLGTIADWLARRLLAPAP